MMYSGLPAGHRVLVKASLASAWALSGLAGLSAVLLSPVTIISEIGAVGTVLSGLLMIASTTVAIIGVTANRYWLEWVASWCSAASIAPYLITVWSLVFSETVTRSTQAFLVTSLVAFYMSRAALCGAHAAKLREAHSLGTAAMDIITEGEAGNDRGTGSGG